MARGVFYSFHYKRDIAAANIVRKASEFIGVSETGCIDRSIWESAHARGDYELRKLISEALVNTTVTVVLIGADTWRRECVHYEIFESRRRGNGLLGIRIHNVGFTPGSLGAFLRVHDKPGPNPFVYHRPDGTCIRPAGSRPYLDALMKRLDTTTIEGSVDIYDWVPESSPYEIGSWAESAFNHRELTRIRSDAKWVPGGW